MQKENEYKRGRNKNKVRKILRKGRVKTLIASSKLCELNKFVTSLFFMFSRLPDFSNTF